MFSSLHQGLWVWFGAAWTRFVCEVQLQRLVCLRRVSAGMSLWPVTPRVFAYNLYWGWQMFWKKTCEFRIAITTIHLKVFWIFYIVYKSWNVLLTTNGFCIKFYFTFNITIIAQSFKIRLWILFLASLKINDWLIKKRSYSWKQLRKWIYVCPCTKKREEMFNEYSGIVIDSLLIYIDTNYS